MTALKWNGVVKDFVDVGRMMEDLDTCIHSMQYRDHPIHQLHEIRRKVRALDRLLTHIIFRIETNKADT